jgi:acyl carrier protein
MSAVEVEVVELVSQQLDIPTSGISRTSRLLEDLGVDGDDAVELIDAFAARFSPDLEPLGRHWSRHFGPEGWSFPDRRLNYAMFAGLGLFAAASAGLAPGLTFPLAVVIIVGAIVTGVIAGRKAPPMLPVTVGDLIEAAETGVWPLRYDDPP